MRGLGVAIGLGGLGAGIGVLLLGIRADHGEAQLAFGLINAFVIWSFVGSGLVARRRRPGSRLGALMLFAGFSWALAALQNGNSSVLFTIGLLAGVLPLGTISHVILAYPEGRLGSRVARGVVAAAYLNTLLLLPGVLFREPDLAACPCPANLVQVSANEGLASAFSLATNTVGALLALAVIALLVRRFRDATVAARRALRPFLTTGSLAGGWAIVLFVSTAVASGFELTAQLATFAALALVPIGFLLGLVHVRLARTAVSRLMVELNESKAPGRLREAIARALGDPSLALAFWLPETGSWVDSAGRPMDVADVAADRAVKLVERDGRRIGALVFDGSLADQHELVDGVCAAAGLALENERLQAELRARLDDLQASEERLRALIDASPLAIVEVDLEGRVAFWNRAAERLYGWSAAEVIGEELQLVPEGHPGGNDEVRTAALAGHAFVEVETVRRRKDGSLVDVSVSAGPVRASDGQVGGYMAVSADISERKRAEEALRHERDFISTLIDSTACLVIVFDRDGRFVRFNHACEQLTGYTFDEVRGRPFWELFIDPSEEEAIRAALARVWSGDFPSENENHWRLRDGSRRLIAWSNTVLRDRSGNVEYLVSSGLDITDRKRAEDELRASRMRILEAQDATRRRLERNLHDGAQQRLVALSLGLRMAEAKTATDPEEAARMLAAAGEELRQAIDELRELARGIHPAVLTDRGLPAALDALAGRSPTPVDVTVELSERLPPPVEAAAYYVVSEALANVAKYAEATAISIVVGRTNGAAVVEVADDGIGGADPQAGSGLRGLTDRVEALNGTLEIRSVPGEGTQVVARLPL
jgi:PAS domain S-box-containing protein